MKQPTQICNQITDETANRISGDANTLASAKTYTDSAVSNEATARQTADTNLQNNLNSAVTNLRTDINNEVNRATNSETTISNTVSTVQSSQQTLSTDLQNAQSSINSLNSSVGGQSAEIQALKSAIQSLMNEVTSLRTDSSPIGTIMAFAGPVAKVPAGWELCDGRLLSRDANTQALFDAIGVSWGSNDAGVTNFRLPDLRGRFLRGLDADVNGIASGRDPDRNNRLSGIFGANFGNTVGSVQGDATKRPNSGWGTSANGEHSHGMNFELTASRDPNGGQYNTVAYAYIGTHAYPYTNSAGNHSHSILGGDSETRPQNAAVLYIIRVK